MAENHCARINFSIHEDLLIAEIENKSYLHTSALSDDSQE